MIVIVKYGHEDVSQLVKAMTDQNFQVEVSDQEAVIAASQCVILPNGSNYQAAMASLTRLDLLGVLKKHVQAGKGLLGIGLGMQLLFEGATVGGFTPGLALLEGLSESLPAEAAFPLPHAGTTPLIGVEAGNPLTENLDGQSVVYDHQLTIDCELDQIKALSQYSLKFPAIIQAGTVVGFQFLPELSSGGQQALVNFLNLVTEKEVN